MKNKPLQPNNNATLSDATETYTSIQVVTAVAFMCGMQQVKFIKNQI